MDSNNTNPIDMNKPKKDHPRNTRITVGVIGFIVGACSVTMLASYDLINRSIALVREEPNATPTSTSIPPSPTPAARQFDELFSEISGNIYRDPSEAIVKLEPILTQEVHILDLAHAQVLIAKAHDILGNYEEAAQLQERIIALLEPTLNDFSSPEEIAEAYSYIISAAIWLGDLESVGDFDQQLTERFERVVESIDSAFEIAEAYSNLIDHYYWLNKLDMVKYHANQFFEKVDPLLPGITDVREITTVYQHIFVAMQRASDNDRYSYYLEALIEQLVQLETQTYDPEELILLYSFLGDAEYARGRYLISASYYRKLIQYERTASNLNNLAYAYWTAGDNICAYHWYQELLLEDDQDLDSYRSGAEQTVAAIEEIYSGNVPDCQ